MLRKIHANQRATVFVDVREFPDTDINNGDLYYQGWMLEVLPPGEEEFEVVPAEFIDATILDDGKLPGQISPNHVIQHPKQAVAFEVERFAEARAIQGAKRKDGVWKFAIRHVSISGVVGGQEPYATLMLDLSKPGKTDVMPVVGAFPATRALHYG